MKVRNHGGQNFDRPKDFVLVKFVYILWLWKTIEGNYGVESVAIGVGCWAEQNERVKEKKPTSWYPSDILLIIDTRPCSHVPSWMISSLTLLKNDRVASDPYISSESRWLNGKDKMQPSFGMKPLFFIFCSLCIFSFLNSLYYGSLFVPWNKKLKVIFSHSLDFFLQLLDYILQFRLFSPNFKISISH